MAIDTKAMGDILKKGLMETINEAAARAFYQNPYQQNVIANPYVNTGGPMPTVTGTLYDGASDTYIDQMSDGTVRMRKLNKTEIVTSPTLTVAYGTGTTTSARFLRSSGDTITTWGMPVAYDDAPVLNEQTPEVEKSPEEKMEDALDAAVRAARKAV